MSQDAPCQRDTHCMDAQIAGILVLNAHRASDASGEGFAVRLFRGANRSGFVRALTDQPTALTAGFAKVCSSCMQTARPRLGKVFPKWRVVGVNRHGSVCADQFAQCAGLWHVY